MKLPGLPIKKKEIEKNYYLNLILRDEKISSAILEENSGQISLVSKNEEVLSKSIEELSDEEFLNTLDKVISSAEEKLPDGIQTHNTVFSLKNAWVEDGKIKKDYLSKLKKASQELDLKPIGFLIVAEAISHLLQKEEGAPISAILTEIGKSSLSATIIRAGRIIEERRVPLEGSAPASLETLLKHIGNIEILPSRILILDNNTDDLTQEFSGYSWDKALPFLHLPQISNLSSNFDVKATVFGTANQMGAIVSGNNLDNVLSENIIPELTEDQFAKDEGKEKETDQDFGFLEEKDISKQKPEEKISQVQENKIIGDNIQEIPTELKIENEEKQELPVQASFLTLGLKNTVQRLKFLKLPKTFPKLPAGRGKFLFVVPLIIVLLILVFIWTLVASRANIILSVTPKAVEKEQNITFSASSNTDPKLKVIKASFPTISEDGKMTQDTTGQKETGDKAHGTVTIFNLSSGSKSFSAGTKITSSNNLDFVLDKSISVASQSGDATSPTPGKTDVTVTASSFGTTYNLPSGTKFSVGDNSTAVVAGKNDNPFSGGTTKKITVVSADDLKQLSDNLLKSLESKAHEDIQKQANSDNVILPDFIDETFDVKDYSKKVGDEADSVSLTGTVSFKAISYNKTELAKFAKAFFEEDIEKDLTINADDISIDVSGLKNKGNDATASVKLKANLIPKIDDNLLPDEIKGKSLKEAIDRLSSIPEVNNVNIKISPSIPFLPKFLPKSSKNIKIYLNING